MTTDHYVVIVCMMMKMSMICLSQWFHAVIEAGGVTLSTDILSYSDLCCFLL